MKYFLGAREKLNKLRDEEKAKVRILMNKKRQRMEKELQFEEEKLISAIDQKIDEELMFLDFSEKIVSIKKESIDGKKICINKYHF